MNSARIIEVFITQEPEISAHCLEQGGAHIGAVHFQQNLFGRTQDRPLSRGAHMQRFYCTSTFHRVFTYISNRFFRTKYSFVENFKRYLLVKTLSPLVRINGGEICKIQRGSFSIAHLIGRECIFLK